VLVVSGAADGDVAVRVGLSIDARLTYLTEDDKRPAELLDFIGAVLDGGAREGAVLCPRRSLLDLAGAWMGIT
jgi:hypothetical protein